MRRFALAGILLICAICFSGSETGNGARAVLVGPTEGPKTAILTDFWEAAHPFFVREYVENQNHYQMINEMGPIDDWGNPIINERLEKFVRRIRTLHYLKNTKAQVLEDTVALNFQQKWEELRKFKMIYMDSCPTLFDVGRLSIPAVYKVIQAVSTNLLDKTICISNVFMKYTQTPTMQAAVMFHELSYFVGKVYFGHHTSDLTRELVAMVFSADFDQVSDETLRALMIRFVNNRPVYTSQSDKIILKNSFSVLSRMNPSWNWKMMMDLMTSREFIQPENLLERFDRVGSLIDASSSYNFGYASEFFQKERYEWLTHLSLQRYKCGYGFELHKRAYSGRGLGEEVQLFVVPPVDGVKFSPGDKWIPHATDLSTKELDSLRNNTDHFLGPTPYAHLIFSAPDSEWETWVGETVLISGHQRQIVWSLGGLTGQCTKQW